ncbi:MAG TPA: hypothetical protein PKZ90_04010, partial [Chitinophagaceae bacterium]|nr:hypothetical protein [Chitinophagaceae bacterium]
PKNSIGFTVSRLMIVSVNALRFMFLLSRRRVVPDYFASSARLQKLYPSASILLSNIVTS